VCGSGNEASLCRRRQRRDFLLEEVDGFAGGGKVAGEGQGQGEGREECGGVQLLGDFEAEDCERGRNGVALELLHGEDSVSDHERKFN